MDTAWSINLLLALTCCSTLISAFSNDLCYTRRNQRSSSTATGKAGNPLFLTPLIDSGKFGEARSRSEVRPNLLDDIKSYSGFLTVNRTTRSHLFFWYVPKTGTYDATAPFILWLAGGPGESSMIDLFLTNGPFKVTPNGLQKRAYAWTDHYNILYIDQPVGTGFSFTEANGYISTETEVGEQLYEALQQFYKVFSELKNRDFFISGQSYAGKFVPAIARKIHIANGRKPVFKIPLKGLTIGNAWSDPENQCDFAVQMYWLGLIDNYERSRLEGMQEKFKYLIRSAQWSRAWEEILGIVTYQQELIGTLSLADYTRDNTTGDEDFSRFVDYLTQDSTRESIHVGRLSYNASSDLVLEQFTRDFPMSVRPWIEDLLEHYPMLFYNGQLDLLVPAPLTQNVLSKLHWSGALNYSLARKRIWQQGKSTAGYYKVAGNLVFVVVLNAGHVVPPDQPKNSLALIDMFIGKKLN